ncbi:TonB-dependent receptor [Granulibacter bethesdensis]|uniref:TonB-dependent receptor n=1 Tax=Granulibacter bethesdensis TaxID=364410 RepID=UPI00090A2911|nr:TonB-dependent receptor [Granulibacter bethesdensis]APH60243.1 putative tonB-dependent receptor yncD precursor [Granulibacter bethesdensis]
MRKRIVLAAVAPFIPAVAMAQGTMKNAASQGNQAAASSTAENNTPNFTLPSLQVVGTTPLQGSGLNREEVPAATQVYTGLDTQKTGPADLLRSLEQQGTGISFNQAVGNSLQPNLIYRGFSASPLAGDPQGLAVYVNGTRFNQSFGDTVNWDLIPSIAIDETQLVGANPAFGLNALGGALSVRMKDGFNYQGGQVEVSGGSFGNITLSGQYGVKSKDGTMSAYIAASGMNEDGWRQHSPSQARQVYGDIGWRSDRAEAHVNVTYANNILVGNGTTPVELLAADRSAVFTYPDQTRNKYVRVVGSTTVTVTDEWSVQGNVYYSNLSQRTFNGDAAEVEPCDNDPTLVCSEDGPPLQSRRGGYVPNFVQNSPYNQHGFDYDEGGPYAFLNRTATDTNGFGASAQGVNTATVFGHKNHFVAGVSYDGGRSTFTANTLIGPLTLDRGFGGPSIEVDDSTANVLPVRVNTSNDYYGVFFTDTFDITEKLAATVSGRFNSAQIALNDQIGTSLNGQHSYNRFNPAAGLTWKITRSVSAYAGYAESNRAPTPAELSCADPTAPCSLTNFFVGDPPLKQVVAHTWEAGFRGHHKVETATVNWHTGYFHTGSDDDLAFVSSETSGRAYFRNVGPTTRQGVEASVNLIAGAWSVFANYSFTDARYGSNFTLNSEDNPYADDGLVNVRKGNYITGIPAHVFKVGVQWAVTPKWVVGLIGRAASGQYLIGDEGNQNQRTGNYFVMDFNTAYQITKNVQLFGMVRNLTNQNYATFGTFSPVGEVPMLQAPNATNTRSLSPGAPIAGYGGVRVSF